MVKFYSDWVSNYPIISIEDGLDEDDWDSWVLLTKNWGKRSNWSVTISILRT